MVEMFSRWKIKRFYESNIPLVRGSKSFFIAQFDYSSQTNSSPYVCHISKYDLMDARDAYLWSQCDGMYYDSRWRHGCRITDPETGIKDYYTRVHQDKKVFDTLEDAVAWAKQYGDTLKKIEEKNDEFRNFVIHKTISNGL